jgi:hypothetical protein
MNKSKARAIFAAAMVMRSRAQHACTGRGRYTVECVGADGARKWLAQSENLVVNFGLKTMNDAMFNGVVAPATWFLGLYGSGATNEPADTDTAALHPGWVEVTPYSNATRPAAVFVPATDASPSVITNEASPAQYNIDTLVAVVIGGAFLISNNVKGGTTGILFSAADLQAPGDRSVINGDIINVTYRFELTAD